MVKTCSQVFTTRLVNPSFVYSLVQLFFTLESCVYHTEPSGFEFKVVMLFSRIILLPHSTHVKRADSERRRVWKGRRPHGMGCCDFI